ncbi:MAG: DUF3943 domain-containing protein [Kofleriaceae bacterium]
MRLVPLALLLATATPVAAQPGLPIVDVDKTGVSVTKDDPPVKRSYALATIEVLALDIGLSISSQLAGFDWAYVDPDSMKLNLERGFGYDDDPYTTNQLAHPMGGVALFSAARSTGHGFWVSGAYAFGGSLIWEVFLENERPSLNDQITTPFVGMLLGEPIHRFTRALLDPRHGKPGWFRKGAATLLDPIAAANRSWYGDAWYRTVPPSLYAHFGVGVSQQTDAVLGDHARDAQVHLEFVAEHGLTGDADFTPRRPLDHFELRGALDMNGDDLDGNLYTRGLALGRGFGDGGNIRGLGGLFAAYDFSNQERVRHSMLGVGPGITAELGFGDRGYLQGTATGYFVPWGAGGGLTEDERMDRDYHRGPGAAALGELRFGRRGTGELRVASRLYEIRGTLVDDDADERILTTTAGARVTLATHHAVGVEGTYGTRRATFSDGVVAADRVAEGRLFYAVTTDGLFY